MYFWYHLIITGAIQNSKIEVVKFNRILNIAYTYHTAGKTFWGTPTLLGFSVYQEVTMYVTNICTLHII